MRKITILAGAAIAALAIPAAASAYTIDTNTGKGFVGKGEVQSVFPALKNNAAIQAALVANPQAVTFSSSQAASQSLSQTAEQSGSEDGSQTGTQPMSMSVSQSVTEHYRQDVECDTTNGRNKLHREGDRSGNRVGVQIGTREGSRDASRSASRDGIRTGSRTGSLTGSLNSVLNGDPRQTKGQNQFTGFNLGGFKTERSFTASSAPVWGDASFGDWDSFGPWGSFGEWGSFGATTYGAASYSNPTFDGPVEWGGWVTDEGDGNPATCLSGNTSQIEHLVDSGAALTSTSYGDQVDGEVTPGVVTPGEVESSDVVTPSETITYGDTIYGTVSTTGPAIVSATYQGVTKTL